MGTTSTARSVVGRVQEENVTFIAASIAYYAFFSIIPLLLLALAIGSLVGGQGFADRIVALVGEHLSSQGETVVGEALANPSGRAGASVASIAALTWSALKVFRSIDLAFDQVYQTDAETSLVGQVVDGLTVLVMVGLAVVVMVGVGTFISRPEIVSIPYVNLVGWLVLVVGLVIVFLPLYYVMPPVSMTVSEALPGAIVVAVGWLVLQGGFQLYAANAGDYEAYGLLGAVLLFLTWLYFASVLVLLGAAVNAVLGNDHR